MKVTGLQSYQQSVIGTFFSDHNGIGGTTSDLVNEGTKDESE